MDNYKHFIDILSSLASLIAIITVLWSWYKNSQLALAIERIVVHKKENESNYILIVKNRKSYPVTIKSISCYLKATYNVFKKRNYGPEYMAGLALADRIFISNDNFEIGAEGHTEIKISGGKINANVSKLLFSIQTTHGYHQIFNNNIVTVDMTKAVKSTKLDKSYKYDSKLKAKMKYHWLKFINSFGL